LRRSTSTVVALSWAALLLAACGSTNTPEAVAASAGPSGPSSARQQSPTGAVNVFAAASLKEAFTKIGAQFEAAHPGTRVVFSFGPSSGLAMQITSGAPADVFASASATNMDQLVKTGDASGSATFARNVMQIAVPAANPSGITGVADLARAGVKVALCQPAVPCGTVASMVFANARITVTPVTQEVDVKGVLTKVSLGEVDAGVVYVTDVKTAGGKVKGIEIPADLNASADYPIATLTRAANAAGARAFTDYVLSPSGAGVLAEGGFARP